MYNICTYIVHVDRISPNTYIFPYMKSHILQGDLWNRPLMMHLDSCRCKRGVYLIVNRREETEVQFALLFRSCSLYGRWTSTTCNNSNNFDRILVTWWREEILWKTNQFKTFAIKQMTRNSYEFFFFKRFSLWEKQKIQRNSSTSIFSPIKEIKDSNIKHFKHSNNKWAYVKNIYI